MNRAFPYAAFLGLLIILLLQFVVMPTLDAQAAARDMKRQQFALVEQNKRLFMKYRPDDNALLVPLSAERGAD
jgi:hypothetical protein